MTCGNRLTQLAGLCLTIGILASVQAVAEEKPALSPGGKSGSTGGIAIAVVNVQRIIRESAAMQSIQPQKDKLLKGFQKEVKRQKAELNKANQELVSQRAILAPEAYDDKRQELQRKASAAQRSLQARKRVLGQAIGKSIEKIHIVLRQVTIEIAEERNISLVLTKPAVFILAKRHNVTDLALERLNKRLPSVNITVTEKK